MQFVFESIRDEFNALGFALLLAALAATGVWLLAFATRWVASRPRLPDAAPETSELGPEPPAIANLLVNRCGLTHSAIAATFLDLCARGALALDHISEDNFVVRLREPSRITEPLSDFEQRVLDLVKERATGGSCPVAALELRGGDYWWKRFEEGVVEDARRLGLVRNRWSKQDWSVLGSGLAVALGLYALSFGVAGIGDSGTNSDEDIGLFEWLGFAALAWGVAMAGLSRLKSIRETAAGRAACAHWLGVRGYFSESHAFDDAPASSVIVWERNLAYAAATGVAHEAVRGLPFELETPEAAWSRYGGSWHEVRIRYPSRFGACQSPGIVFLSGAARAIFFGGLAFIALPIALQVAIEFVDALRDDTTISNRATVTIVATLAGIVSVAGLYLTLRFLGGAIRIWRAVLDFGKPLVIEGEVIKLHAGRVAVFDGKDTDVVAWLPPTGAPSTPKGSAVRVTLTPRLHWVKDLEVITALAPAAAAAATTPSPPAPA